MVFKRMPEEKNTSRSNGGDIQEDGDGGLNRESSNCTTHSMEFELKCAKAAARRVSSYSIASTGKLADKRSSEFSFTEDRDSATSVDLAMIMPPDLVRQLHSASQPGAVWINGIPSERDFALDEIGSSPSAASPTRNRNLPRFRLPFPEVTHSVRDVLPTATPVSAEVVEEETEAKEMVENLQREVQEKAAQVDDLKDQLKDVDSLRAEIEVLRASLQTLAAQEQTAYDQTASTDCATLTHNNDFADESVNAAFDSMNFSDNAADDDINTTAAVSPISRRSRVRISKGMTREEYNAYEILVGDTDPEPEQCRRSRSLDRGSRKKKKKWKSLSPFSRRRRKKRGEREQQ